ncbi:hypothetical protein PF001_g4595 [Phytophthora fragariae]|uniref:RNase H type-1 domain-containing protein n=1 Tax=Phytophthora fragariae TaxID=53985 RepID=A0A6A4EP08_9STRA|nr:hypothetical protein PF006_g27456 [Phytophthora fragariae]KAE9322083.1 hypothetical protein PF001_g4595 [Phytophthora fragariae]
MSELPAWLTEWGTNQDIEPWENVCEIASAMWALGAITTISVLWRLNVDRRYPEGKKQYTPHEQLRRYRGAITEAYERFRLMLYPLTRKSHSKILVAERVIDQWKQEAQVAARSIGEQVVRLGFFDGGSRGNPGPGGSGSIFVELRWAGEDPHVVWAAATALARKTTTNNVAEFVGLHRLLKRAVECGWRGVHVVGDSAMIIEMMSKRKVPKSSKMQHWYRATRKLADRCEVATWEHHFRSHNKWRMR